MSPPEIAAPSPRLSTFHIPDLFAHCNFTFTCHPNGYAINDASILWYDNMCSDMTDGKRRALKGLKSGLLAAYIYHDASDEHLRVISDFVNYTFLLDDLSDKLSTKDNEALEKVVANAMEHPHSYRRTLADGSELPEQEPDASKLARDFWVRCLPDARPGFKTRFIQSTPGFMKAISQQSRTGESGVIPSLSAYIEARRGNSGVWPFLDALEYSHRIDLPDHVIEHPIIVVLRQCTNDFVSWSNDMYSFNVEHARGDWNNMVAIFMKHHGLDIQGAVNRTAEMCCQVFDKFYENKAKLPSWGPEIDKDVSLYVGGLESWMSGNLYWSFATESYFGPEVLDIKQNKVVKLLPPKRPASLVSLAYVR